ncbi:ribosome biogenesis protein MAK21 [Trypanosoma conorhini]|uniref:Ribosome biogenesis protein MAK21 n=1 Tax=Trypanosoma conorhini TaxID=83891 RepID=A0A3R7NRE7_9TRYP|nr:ribosome biogenesis protein MAK21 [Trypanosoma conorhini]RNF25896.1 ribosome biogenesis protein MAK21 [Trypanosoma conorhini]
MAAAAESVLDLNKRWYERSLPLRSCSLKEVANSAVTKDEMDAMFCEAQEALDAETAQSQTDKGRWYNSQFISRGTTADKIASAAVKLSDVDFMFFLDGFNLLFDTARTDTHHYEAALKALAVVWPKLLPHRPLKRFVTQFFTTLPTDAKGRKTVLVYWYIEDYLKRTYAQFLSLAESMLKDRLQKRREAWLEVVGKLMCSIAEGRHVAMALIVDKLGDPTSRVAHQAYHHLLSLLKESSTHQATLFVELEKAIFMNNCPVATMKYAANVMNQFVYTKEERKLALKSVQTYLALFRKLVMNASVDLSVTTAILVGLRRAFPYAGTDIAPLEEHLNALFVLANTGTFIQRVATMSLLQLISHGKGATTAFQNRWYRALYNLLLISPKQLSHSTQMAGFFSMLHKALRMDKNEERLAAFAHRLLQRSLYFSDSVVCAILLLVGEMFQAHPRLRALVLGTRKKPLDAAAERYDVRCREPQFSHATKESLWTLGTLARHSHPSVVKLAVMLMFNEDVVFDSHPLDELTLPNFLTIFVDARAQPKEEEEVSTGMSVFSRVVHTPNIPSASDPYFINASAQQVDVSALFLHRYAVQRQRFLDGLSQVRSTWGDASGEADVALRVKNVDASLFGPAGMLGGEASGDGTKAKKKKRSEKEQPHAAKAVEFDEEVASDGSGDGSQDGDGDDFDVAGSEGDLEWGSNDEAAYDDLHAAEDYDEEEEDYEDADVAGETALGGTKAPGDLDGGELAELLDANRKGLSKKRRRAEEWLDRATAAPAPPPSKRTHPEAVKWNRVKAPRVARSK